MAFVFLWSERCSIDQLVMHNSLYSCLCRSVTLLFAHKKTTLKSTEFLVPNVEMKIYSIVLILVCCYLHVIVA